jgi:hypothetical protein
MFESCRAQSTGETMFPPWAPFFSASTGPPRRASRRAKPGSGGQAGREALVSDRDARYNISGGDDTSLWKGERVAVRERRRRDR